MTELEFGTHLSDYKDHAFSSTVVSCRFPCFLVFLSHILRFKLECGGSGCFGLQNN